MRCWADGTKKNCNYRETVQLVKLTFRTYLAKWGVPCAGCGVHSPKISSGQFSEKLGVNDEGHVWAPGREILHGHLGTAGKQF